MCIEKPIHPSTSSGETKLEARFKEPKHSTRTQQSSMKGHLHLASSACHEAVDRRGNVKEVPSLGPNLCRSRSVKDDHENVLIEEKCRNECRRLSGGKQDLNCKKSNQEVMGKNSTRKQAINKHDGATSKDSPVCSSSSAYHQSNSGLPSSQYTHESITTSQSNGNAILSYTKFFGARKDGKGRNKEADSSKKMDMTQRKGELPFMRSFLRRKVGVGAAPAGKKSSPILNPLEASSEASEGETQLAGGDSENNLRVDATGQHLDLCSSVFEGASSSKHHSSHLTGFTFPQSGSQQLELNSNALEANSMNEELSEFSFEMDSKASLVETQIQGIDTVSPSTPCSLETIREQEDTIARTSESRNLGVWRNIGLHADEVESACCSEIRGPENSVQSSCGSCCSSGDIKDAASTNALPESFRKEAPSFSGKTTAVILQELIMALNTCRPHPPVEKEMSDMSRNVDNSGSLCSSLSEFSGYFNQIDAINDSQEGETSYDSELQHLQFSATATCDGSLTKINEVIRISSPNSRICPDACESSSETAICQDSGLASPISILESPFKDASSDSSDASGNIQGLKLKRTGEMVQANNSKQMSIWDEQDHMQEILCFGWEDVQLHQCRQMQGLPPVDPALFTRLESWLVRRQSFPAARFSDMEDLDSEAVERHELFLKKAGNKAASQNRKLIFDCVNEALSLRLGLYGNGEFWAKGPLISRITPLRAYVERSVGKQVEEWREMGEMLMVDDIVEKEMDRWRNIDEDVLEIVMEIEDSLLGSLVEEMMDDLGSMMVRKTMGPSLIHCASFW